MRKLLGNSINWQMISTKSKATALFKAGSNHKVGVYSMSCAEVETVGELQVPLDYAAAAAEPEAGWWWWATAAGEVSGPADSCKSRSYDLLRTDCGTGPSCCGGW